MVDTLHLGCSAARHGGSSPSIRTFDFFVPCRIFINKIDIWQGNRKRYITYIKQLVW